MTQTSTPLRYSKLIGRPIDNTALDAWMRCRRLYDYTMRQHRRRMGAPPPALAFGSAWHVAMEYHYRTDGDLGIVVSEVVKRWEQHSRPNDHRTLDRILLDYERYVKLYGSPSHEAKRGQGITLERAGQKMLEISIELPIPGARHPYTGKIDRIVELDGAYYIDDHKTTTMLRDDYFQQFEMSNQMIGYAALAELLSGIPIRGVRINALICSKVNTKFERFTITYPPERIREWYEVLDAHMADIERAERATLDGDPLAFPANFNACAHKYGMCQFVSICTLAPKRRQYALEQDFPVNPWNPLEAGEDHAET